MPGSLILAPKEIRARWYLATEKHKKSVVEVCKLFGISKKTYHKWYRRDHGYEDNEYRSRKDHPSLKMSPDIRIDIQCKNYRLFAQ